MALEPNQFPKVLTLVLELNQYPILAPRIRERMRTELFQRGVITQKAFEAEVREKAMRSQQREGLDDPLNQEPQDIWIKRLAVIRDNLTDFYFAYNLPHELFEQILRETLTGRLPPQDVIPSIHPELAPWDMLFAQGEAYEALPPPQLERVKHHLQEIKVVLIKAMISDHLNYVGIAKEWFDMKDLQAIRARRFGRGKIGGKAAGVMLADCILRKSADEDLLQHLHIPESWFIGADVFYEFTQSNEFLVYMNQKYKPEDEIRNEYPTIQENFNDGIFPVEVARELQRVLDQVGSTSLIVRSSSLLEDSFGTSFAGKYESYFCPNQGTPEENLHSVLDAIRRVYASVYSPDVLLYRRRMGLTDYDERMAVLIQEVQGERRGSYFFPDAAGVAFSQNQFRWSQLIKRDAGFVRLVWGLGTRAVDETGGDYPRLVALSHPELRPESDSKQVRRYSQRFIDLIDLEENTFKTLPASDVLDANTPHLRLLAQRYDQGYLQEFISLPLKFDPEGVIITFEGLLRKTHFPEYTRQMLALLQKAYHRPVDTEFALQLKEGGDGQTEIDLCLLQCRPQSHLPTEVVTLPEDIPLDKVLFTTQRLVPDGCVAGVRYAVYVSPQGYSSLPSNRERYDVARMIGRINRTLEKEQFILMGPGRWGSNNPALGIPITYSEIHNASALIEIADGEHAPEPSYGTHFFQDLIEARIYPLALALLDPEAEFNRGFFEASENSLARLLPEASAWESLIRVIDIPAVSDGAHLELVMDGEAGKAMAFLTSISAGE